jgi:hypothetical protein
MKLVEITQRMLEQYEDALVGTEVDNMSVTHFNRLLIEAAKDAGIADDLPDDLGDCKPRDIREWTQQIIEHVREAKEPTDPN